MLGASGSSSVTATSAALQSPSRLLTLNVSAANSSFAWDWHPAMVGGKLLAQAFWLVCHLQVLGTLLQEA